jgi:hypothetical protein
MPREIRFVESVAKIARFGTRRPGHTEASSMCNLYSITTNQAAMSALFRVINRYVGNLPPMPGVYPDYPAPVVRNTEGGRELAVMRWGMPPPARSGGFPVTNIRNNVIAALARLAETGEPLPGPGQQLCRICAGAESRHRQEGHRLVCAQRGPAAVFLCRHLDRISRRPRHQVKANPRASFGLWLPDHGCERGRRTDSSKGDAGHPDER